MAQNKQLTWTELRVGLFVLAGVVLLVIVIFYVTGAGTLGPKYRLRAYLSDVSGLTVGAPVRVDGVDVGNVAKIEIAPLKSGQPEDKDKSIEIDMQVQKSYQDYIRTDSTAGLETEGLLGDQYVDIDRGFVGSVIPNDGVVPGRHEKALKEIVARSADLMDNLGKIADQANDVLADIRSGKGSLGKFLVDQDAYNHLDSSLANLDSVMADVQAGKGTLGQLVTNEELYNRVDSVSGHLDNVLDAVQNKQGTIGKLIYDPGFHDSAKKLIDNSDALIEGVREGKGTLGKLATDDSLFTQYRQVGENLSAATAKLNSNEDTIGKFFQDPKLYDNLSGLTGDMRLLVGDFRRDPKKFLHVKFSIF